MATNSYTKQTWEDAPSTNSPVSAERLNHMETGIKNNNTGVRALETAVGNVQNLDTSSKEIVGSINEINQHLSDKKFGIDTSNVLHSSGSYKNTTKSYTATEDCVVCCSGAYVDQMIFTGFVDGVEVFRYGTYASSMTSPTLFSHTINLAKGSMFAFGIGNSSNSAANGQFKVYALK